MSNSETLVLANLKIIGLVKIHERIYTRYNPVILPNTYWSSIIRTLFQNDNRDHLLQFLELTINDSEIIIKKLVLSSKNVDMDTYLKEIINDYYQSLIGIGNLTQTYKQDHHFVALLQCLLRKCNKFCIEDIPDIISFE